jgi:hypothetical protein
MPDGTYRTQLTNAFSAMGTAPWAAPEAHTDGRSLDPRADIYSLGRIVAWLVSGVLPEANKPSELDATSPWSLFVRETTRQDRDERPPTIYAALEHLKPVIDALASARDASHFAMAETSDASKVTIDALKRYLVEPTQRINLRELVMRETEAVHARLTPEAFSVQTLDNDSIEKRVRRYVDVSSPLLSLVATGCAYGDDAQAEHWSRVLRRIGEPLGEWGGLTMLLHMRYLPASLIMHAGALAAVASQRWVTLRTLIRDTMIRNRTGNEGEAPAVVAVSIVDALEHDVAKQLPGMNKKYFPANEWLFGQLREPLRFLLPSDSDFEDAFHRMEYLLALVYADLGANMYAPTARVTAHDVRQRRFKGTTVADRLRSEFDLAKRTGGWPSAAVGLFSNSDRVVELIDQLDKNWSSLGWF